MLLSLENKTAAGTRRLLMGIAAAVGVACGATTTLAQAQGGGGVWSGTFTGRAAGTLTPPAPPAPPAAAAPAPAPSPLAPMVFAHGGGRSDYTFKSVENGREVELRLENDQVVKATVDGQDIPPDRIEREGDTIRLKSAAGSVVFEHTLPSPSRLRLHAITGQRGSLTLAPALGQWRTQRPGSIPGPDDNVAFTVTAEPPNVMLGVTMSEPDQSLRGHFGLEPGAATLVSTIYEGLPASLAGLEPYDIIVAVDGQRPAGQETVRSALRAKDPGDEVKLTIIHRGQERDVAVKLEKYDPERFKTAKARAALAAPHDVGVALAELMATTGNDPVAAESLRRSLIGLAQDPSGQPSVFFSPQTHVEMQELYAKARADAERSAARARELVEKVRERADDTERLEDRLTRLERMLERVLQEREASGRKEPSGGGRPNPPPAPPSAHPATGSRKPDA